MNWYKAWQFAYYLFVARHRKGYGIHSPFAFELVREIVYQKQRYYFYDKIEAVRRDYSRSRQYIQTVDFGTGGVKKRQKAQSVADIVCRAAVRPKYGRLLSRLVARFAPQSIVELGTSLGIATMYLAYVNRKSNVVTLEGCPQTLAVAHDTFIRQNLPRIKCVQGNFDDVLEPMLSHMATVDFVFVDGNHRGEATMRYFNLFLGKVSNDSVLIFDDIHSSPDMTAAWRQIVDHPLVTVSMDLFQFGIVFFRKECQKQHYVVRY